MNEQEARAAFEPILSECAILGWAADRCVGEREREQQRAEEDANTQAFYAALAVYRDAVLAAQPCYEAWFADHSQGDCLQDGGTYRCPSCQARERMKARELMRSVR